MATRMDRRAYAGMFGPTVGDRIRLADTEIIIEVEADHTIYGEEVKFGGGKVIRDGMGQSQVTNAEGAVDTVITNAVILDHWGIVKADIGLKGGLIVAIGKAGNPDIQPGVTIIIGPGTEVIAGEGKILTAGGIDSHIHFICPQQVEEALFSGITTMLGGGTGPAAGTNATTCTPGPWHLMRMLQAAEGLPMNLGFFGKGEVFGDRGIEMVAHHQHIQMLVDGVARERPGRVGRGWQHVLQAGDLDDVRRVAAAGAFGMKGMDGAALERLDGILDKARLVQGVGMDHDLDVVIVGNRKTIVDRGRRGAPILVQLERTGAGLDHLDQ